MLAGIRRTKILRKPPLIVAHLDPSGVEVMHALATVGALVALADGLLAEVERDSLINFSTTQGFISNASESAVRRVFDDHVEQLKGPACARVVRQSLRPLVGHPLAWVVVQTAEKVAAADGIVHPGELRALDVLRRVMKAHSPPKRLPRLQKRDLLHLTLTSTA